MLSGTDSFKLNDFDDKIKGYLLRYEMSQLKLTNI